MMMTLPADVTEQQLEAVYRANARRVYGFARNRVGETDGAEIVSEVFHAAALSFRRGDGDHVTSAWLMAVARNKINDHWRRSYRGKAKRHLTHLTTDELVHFPPDWHDDPRRAAVIVALDALPAWDRSLLVLHHVDGMPIAEIAESTDKSVAAIESALARSRRKFKNAYSGNEIDE